MEWFEVRPWKYGSDIKVESPGRDVYEIFMFLLHVITAGDGGVEKERRL